MTSDPSVERVVAHFDQLLGTDATLVVESITTETVHLRYEAGTTECAVCVLAPDELEVLVGEALERSGAGTRAVLVRDLRSHPDNTGEHMDKHPTDRLSHAIFCVAAEDFDDCRRHWQEALGVELEDIPLPDEADLRVVFSLQHGIEIVSPSGPNAPPAMVEFLERSGNGLYALVYSVPQLEPAVDRAVAGGAEVTDRFVYTGIAPWSDTYDVLEEAVLAPYKGMHVVLAQIDLR